jgi:hypothetical protein
LNLLGFLAGFIDPGGHDVEQPYRFVLFQGDVNLSRRKKKEMRRRREPVKTRKKTVPHSAFHLFVQLRIAERRRSRRGSGKLFKRADR